MILPRTILLWSLFLAGYSHADEEQWLPWRTLTLECGQFQEVGKVTLKASTDGTAFQSFEIQSFGKTHQLSPAELESLRGFPLHSLSVTHSPGYPPLGGHGVYFKLRRTFYNASQKLKQEEVTVAVHANHKVAVSARDIAAPQPPTR
jgi:hypothetical protein